MNKNWAFTCFSFSPQLVVSLVLYYRMFEVPKNY